MRYQVTILYENQAQSFAKELSIDDSINLSKEEIREIIVNDFYSTHGIDIVGEDGEEY